MGKIWAGPSGDGTDTARYRALAAASRVRIVHLVRGAGNGMNAAEVAEATGLHPSTVRAHLDQLTETGLLTRDRRGDGSPGRPAWRYRAVPDAQAWPDSGAAAGTGGGRVDRPFRDLAAALVAHLARSEADPHAAGIQAGRDWGRTLAASLGRAAPLEGLTKILERLGFTPRRAAREPDDGWATIHLSSCPFLELAETSPDVVCGVHLGVVGGALGALGASAADTDLRPFAVPGACVVRVRLGAAGGTELRAAGGTELGAAGGTELAASRTEGSS